MFAYIAEGLKRILEAELVVQSLLVGVGGVASKFPAPETHELANPDKVVIWSSSLSAANSLIVPMYWLPLCLR